MTVFDGFWPALLTPYTSDDQINFTVLRELVDYHLAKNVTGFYICGSTGEGAFQSTEERLKIAETVMERVNGRVPVMIHVGASAINESIHLAQHAESLGAAGISSIVPPVVYNPAGIAPFLERIASAAPGLPFFPYLFGGNINSLALLNELAHIPNFRGTKYFGPNMYEMGQIVLFRKENWTVFSGMDEQAVLGLMYGAHGVIGSTLNFMPGVYRKMIEHLRAGEAGESLKFQERGNRITQIMLELGFVGCMRAAMSKLGFDVGEPRLPNLPLPKEKRDMLFAKLEEAGFQELVDL